MIVPYLQQAVLSLPWPSPLRTFLAHPAGPFTIFFWAPTFKWMITFSNLKDLERPAHLISANQQIAIAITGVLWSYYS